MDSVRKGKGEEIRPISSSRWDISNGNDTDLSFSYRILAFKYKSPRCKDDEFTVSPSFFFKLGVFKLKLIQIKLQSDRKMKIVQYRILLVVFGCHFMKATRILSDFGLIYQKRTKSNRTAFMYFNVYFHFLWVWFIILGYYFFIFNSFNIKY